MGKVAVQLVFSPNSVLSTPADLGGAVIAGLMMPMEWTPAHLSVLASPNGVEFSDLYDSNGQPVMLPVGVPGVAVPVPPELATPMPCYIRLRSGTRSLPVPQQDERVVVLMLC